MKTIKEMEYSNVMVQFEYSHIQRLIERLVEAGLPIAWKQTNRYFTLSIQTSWTTQRLNFDRRGKWYKLRNRNYNIKDQRLSEILQEAILEVKGHAVLKYFSDDQLVVQNIRYGEPIRITEISGPTKKVLFEKECFVSMDDVNEAWVRTDAEERIPVLRREIDDQLERLLAAIRQNDRKKIGELKDELEKLRSEMVMLEV